MNKIFLNFFKLLAVSHKFPNSSHHTEKCLIETYLIFGKTVSQGVFSTQLLRRHRACTNSCGLVYVNPNWALASLFEGQSMMSIKTVPNVINKFLHNVVSYITLK